MFAKCFVYKYKCLFMLVSLNMSIIIIYILFSVKAIRRE
jgi:hypothetical protein